MARLHDGVNAFVIYDRPIDYPQTYVVRRWVLAGGECVPTDDHWLAPTLEVARGYVPSSATVHLPRTEGDMPAIVETWVEEWD